MTLEDQEAWKEMMGVLRSICYNLGRSPQGPEERNQYEHTLLDENARLRDRVAQLEDALRQLQ